MFVLEMYWLFKESAMRFTWTALDWTNAESAKEIHWLQTFFMDQAIYLLSLTFYWKNISFNRHNVTLCKLYVDIFFHIFIFHILMLPKNFLTSSLTLILILSKIGWLIFKPHILEMYHIINPFCWKLFQNVWTFCCKLKLLIYPLCL